MALYLVRRTNPFGSLQDMDAAMLRALMCASAFPDLKWLRTYYTEDAMTSYCLYEADSADEIRTYSERASIPYDEVIQVNEMTAAQFWAPANEQEPELAVAG